MITVVADNEDKFFIIPTSFNNLFLDFWRKLSFNFKFLFPFFAP